MPLSLRPNDFTQPDFDVIWRDGDGPPKVVGRIYEAWPGGSSNYWFWSVDFFHRKGRPEPHQGRAACEAEARDAWQVCWHGGRNG